MQRDDLDPLSPPRRLGAASTRDGWPWDADPENITDLPVRLATWPRVTIVTPSYNQAEVLEETIRSVLLQGYPNLEYVVMDGGSSDGSVDIIRRYDSQLASWVSERDGGQADAINKGFARTSGEILGWVNSDDVYEPGAIWRAVRHFQANQGCRLVYGDGWHIDERSERTHPCDFVRPFDATRLKTVDYILQPASFWRRSLWEEVGPLSVDLHWTFDWDWYIRASRVTEFCYLSEQLALYRWLPSTKTGSGGRARHSEIARIARRHGGILQPTNLIYFGEVALDPLRDLVNRLPSPLAKPARRLAAYLRAAVKAVFADRYIR
jgi:glycosyltransferase involved in cell wall biosynthesis